jgi:hypothetical protein
MGGIIYIWGQRKGVCVHHATVQKDERQRLGDLVYIGHRRSAPSSARREGSGTGYMHVFNYIDMHVFSHVSRGEAAEDGLVCHHDTRPQSERGGSAQ